MADPTYPLFSVFAFLGFIAALIPLPWHFQAWNAGTCIYMIWAGFASLIQFVNSIVWNGNAENIAPVWCDITTKFLIGAGVGIPASSLCINRRLYKIASIRAVTMTRNDKRRAVFIDIGIAIGIPVLVMVLHYVVQGHRFNILEDIGCAPTIWNTALAYPLVFIWPVLLGCISFVYASLTLRAFLIRRAQFNEIVSSTSSLTMGRYFRLMLLSCTEMACTLPIGIYSIYINTKGVQLAPWVSWADTHFNFSFVEVFPAVIWRSNQAFVISVEMGRWIYPCSALLFFALFGFADEARRNYKAAFCWIKARLGFSPSANKSSKTTGFIGRIPVDGTLPVYTPRQFFEKGMRSLTSSYGETFTNIDLEKGNSVPALPPMSSSDRISRIILPSSPCYTLSVYDTRDEETAVDSEESPRIIISDAFPASVPPSPVLDVYREPQSQFSQDRPSSPRAPSPVDRPFSPPTVRPMSLQLVQPSLPREGSILVMIHTESSQSFST